MIPRLNQEHLDYYLERANALQPGTPRQWGRMDAHRMLVHLNFVLELSLGEHEVKAMVPRILRPVFRKVLFVWFINWPKGKIKAPDMFTPAPESTFEEEREKHIALLKRFAAEEQAQPQRETSHPIFGQTPLADWTLYHAVHFRHHFLQFGLI